MEEFRVISLVLHLRGLSQNFMFGSLIIGEMPNRSRSRSRRHGRSNQRKWRHENPTRCWLTGRKRCGTSVWRSRKASNRYLQGVLAPHAENGLKSRLQIWQIMHTYGYDTGSRRLSTWGLLYDARWLCECNSDPRLISYGLFGQQRLPTRSIGMSRLLIAGHDAAAKARRTFETVLARTRRKLKSALSFQVLTEFSSVLSFSKWCTFAIGFSWTGTCEDILQCTPLHPPNPRHEDGGFHWDAIWSAGRRSLWSKRLRSCGHRGW